ncbi:hypothetical protein IMSAGC011_01495 [Lachnospiraceae bacterium]|nr:hypothetical protein IMSAGC011_01495 [Lachnospiraceae bacterium]
MAKRPVFAVSLDWQYCVCEDIEFEYFSGFSDKQKQRSIQSLHQAYILQHPQAKILEISSKSEEALGVKLSAFHLMLTSNDGAEFSVESAFQAGKVFENGGPYIDLLNVSSREAKKDERLKNSGAVIAFQFEGERFATEPKTYFYQWLYMNALQRYPELTEQLMDYNAFTDIVFNPKKSLNCQAEAAAVYVSLQKQGLLVEALKNKQTFFEIVFQRQQNS